MTAAGDAPHIVVIGLGYVGLPLAVALSAKFRTTGFDIDRRRIDELRDGFDRTREIDGDRLKTSGLLFTSRAVDASGADIYIVTVPTPVTEENQPDLRPLLAGTKTVGNLIQAGRKTIVVYESTVYPGVTEEICGPELERLSGLKRGVDFFLGYSPERINPGDREHTIDRIVKVVAGENPEVTARLVEIYGAITSAGAFPAASIKTAEAAKVIENAQRDINVAFMNEITQIFAKLGLSIWDVLDAAGTKWNFLKFQPGLVGGHCIGVDPYYLSHRAQELGHDPQVILSGRSINDTMGQWVADQLHARRNGRAGSALVLGLTFKEDVPDLRNSKVVDVIERLKQLGHEVTIHDPLADDREAGHEYGLSIDPDAMTRRYDIVLGAVPHAAYRQLSADAIAALANDGGMIADLKGMWRDHAFSGAVDRWTL